MTKIQFKKLYQKAKKEFDNFNYDHKAWFFVGSLKDNIPRWAGYTIGFTMVGNYLKKHLDKKPSNLYLTKIEEFI